MELAGVDLNLLVALDALLSERNVTRAGERIGLSQPATSRALARLRELFDDPLLVRGKEGMRPTPRAEQLAPEVKRILADIRGSLFDRAVFDPATDSRTFTVAVNDYVGAALLPEVVSRIRQAAPSITLRFRSLPREVPARALADGTLDLAVGTFLRVPERLAVRELLTDSFVCAVRAGHPLAKGKLTLKRFVAFDHLLIASPGEGPGVVDLALDQHGLSRRVAVYVPHFLVAPAVVATTDVIVTLARRIATKTAKSDGLTLLEPPSALKLPEFPVQMIWHPRTEEDPGALWLRERFVERARPTRRRHAP